MNLEQIEKYHTDMALERDKLDYEIDGVVIKVNDYALQEKLGMRQRSPRWALAWKFEPKHDVTTVKDIVVQVGRTGVLTPVALLEPVNVGGVTVSRATLHNEGEIRRKDIRIGDTVRIERAGDVIPEVVERIDQPSQKRGRPFSMPKHCPACGTQVEQEGAYRLLSEFVVLPGPIGRPNHPLRRAGCAGYRGAGPQDCGGVGRPGDGQIRRGPLSPVCR